MGRFFATLLTLGAVVGGCTTGEQSTAKQAQADDQACQISGVSPGTQAYSECRTRLAQQRTVSRTQTEENKYQNIDAKMQSGIPPTQSSPYGR
jgi:hypothetical protein